MEYLNDVISYAGLGYSISLINLYGKEAIRMEKEYSYKHKTNIISEQILEWSRLKDKNRRNHIFDFLYNDIKEQEETGKLYKKL